MSLKVLVVLVIIGLLLWLLKWRRTGGLAFALAVVLFVVEGCGWLPSLLLNDLQTPFAKRPQISWAQRSAIVLLGSGTVRTPDGTIGPMLFAYGRIMQALLIYRECKTSGVDCRILVSGGDAVGTGESEAAAYSALLERMGVPASDLLMDSRSMNTWQNAKFSVPLLRAWGAELTVLVSSATHLRRASMYFAHFGMTVVPVRADWLTVGIGFPQYWNFAMTDLALSEYYFALRYRIYSALGWKLDSMK